MLISLQWLRDFVNIPAETDVIALAEAFTRTCAEVEEVRQVSVAAQGLIAARIVSCKDLAGTQNLHHVVLDVGGPTIETVSAAPDLAASQIVVFAPPGGRTAQTGEVGSAEVAGHRSKGMILPGDALGIAMAEKEAVRCPPSMAPGEAVVADILDDWIIEVDNKSITHRPDLWGHYGIAREIAAMLGLPLRPYPVVDTAELSAVDAPAIPIEIEDPDRCPRYTGLRMTGVKAQASPLWMQTRLGRVGMRPIDCLVDLSNYIMAELGQPTHAFDGDKIDRIEVALAKPGRKFTTLDGVERALPAEALMIQCGRRDVALAGIMGGRETEVTEGTRSVLLESANFEPAGIRRCATALGLRTEASARFEKSLDPANTSLAIQRFCHLARAEFPDLALASPLSDCYPKPPSQLTVDVDPAFLRRFMGHNVSVEEMTDILQSIAFDVEARGDRLTVSVPSFRATKDVSIKADVIEEVARIVGYDNIEPRLPESRVRHFERNAQHRIESDTLRQLCLGRGYSEVHLYIWYDDAWTAKLGLELPPGVQLRNPASSTQGCLRHALLPNLLHAADRNRLHTNEFKLCEVGTVFPGPGDSTDQRRHLGIVSARRGRKVEDDLLAEVKGDLEVWCWQVLGVSMEFARPGDGHLSAWVHDSKTADIVIGGTTVGQVSAVPLPLRRMMDEHLSAWAIAWAQIDLGPLADVAPTDIRLRAIPEHPEVQLDFSILVPAERPFCSVSDRVAQFDHPLLRRITYVSAYEGQSVPKGKRSLTYRVTLGAKDRTLVDADAVDLRGRFEQFIHESGFKLRS